jgi:alcohol dehydrogenase class IV
MILPFNFASTPSLIFGVGKVSQLHAVAARFGSRVLLVTGANSFNHSAYGKEILDDLDHKKFEVFRYKIDREPTPEIIDEAVRQFLESQIHIVVGVGGGSVLDAAKAISAMLPLGGSVKDFLEGVGTKLHPGVKVPCIAIPTTSGTGSEATKNAVISEIGEQGFKKSLRHDNFVPNIAIVDPALSITCKQQTTAASGMDAFTQLLESYVSTNANPVTDALALEGLNRISRSLLKAYRNGEDIEARSDMSLAAYLSGTTLANAGLGLVHGFASSVGGFFDIAHGVICSSLMENSNRVTIRKLRNGKMNDLALSKFAMAGKVFSKEQFRSDDFYIDALLDAIATMKSEMKIPVLSGCGVSVDDLMKIAQVTDSKYNPVVLSRDEIHEVLEKSL